MASRNVGVQSTPAYNHVAPVNNGPVHGNVGPVPGGNGPYGHSTHGNYHTGLNISAATAPGSYVNHNSNIDNAQTGYPVGRSDPVVIPHNIIGAAHGTHLVHSSSAGMVVPSNVGAPTPTHAGPQVKYFVNDVTGDKMTLDGTIWTPYGGKKDLFADSSYYNQTEPRNFAPRPMGSPIMFPPPPNFGFAAGANNQAHEIVSSVSMYDPFLSPTSPAIHSVNRAAVSQVDCYEFAYGEPNENEQEICHRWGLLRHKLPELRKMGSDGLKKLIDGYMGIPSEGVLLSLDNFPFIESSSQAMPVAYGVIKIGNIPFGTLRSEVIAFLGRNSKILNDALEPIHIIMERVTSKTGDAFIEFPNHHAACRALDRHSEAIRKHRHPRLGDRPVEMTLSSQKELMEALFPWCRGVRFTNQGRAEMLPFDEVNPWNVFRGFVTEEEMNLVIKHVEVPSRSPYSKDCPQRPFESMISTLKKLPWYRSDVITLKQRQVIYDATCRLLELLAETLLKEDRPVNNRRQENVLNEQLYKRLVNAAMICPGFSVLQKDNIAFIADLDGSRVTQFNMPPFADCWGHLYNLCPRPRVPVDLLEWYISLIREETVRFVGTLPEHEQDAIKERAQEDTLYFGYMWYEIQLPQGKELADMTLREVAKKELEAIKRALRRAATLARNPRAIEGVRHEGHPPVV
ncbi:hypothetical protein QBC40DRAFT_174581 [Triangularia verruculosa]|uniref:RRM domain-containing protein n=1 Tax=Triangularia verruculosa TaxID=2587418 RepID=A0AAN7AUS8_9PEZI|nr:hypothetical protein QBC40DRAFT_174581 [Triangularia verruculosa]